MAAAAVCWGVALYVPDRLWMAASAQKGGEGGLALHAIM